MSENYSVLMSVYYKEHPEYLRQSMQSIYDQTVPTDDFVLVCDGPLTPELDAVIADMQDQFGPRLRVCRLLKNGGLGKSLNFGIKQCKNDLVARMDSDDISRPDRCKRQLAVFADHPDYSIVSGIVEEFSDTPDNISVRRVVPEGQSEIIAFAKKRNPFNHPCVMYKKSAVEAAGGYQDFYLLEDYYLDPYAAERLPGIQSAGTLAVDAGWQRHVQTPGRLEILFVPASIAAVHASIWVHHSGALSLGDVCALKCCHCTE